MAFPKKTSTPLGVQPRIAGSMLSASYLAFVSTGVIIVAGLALLAVSQYRATLAEWEQRLSSIADERTRLVSSWLQERRGDAEANSFAPEVTQYLLRMTAKNIHEEPMLDHLALLSQTKEFYGYTGIYVLDRDGHVVSQAPGSPLPLPLLGGVGRTAIQGRQFHVEWLPSGPDGGSLCLISPVWGTRKKTVGAEVVTRPLGAVALVVNPHETLFRLLATESIPTETGETLLVARAGRGILFMSPLRRGSLRVHAAPRQSTLAATAALEGRQTFGSFTDYRGVPVLAAVRSIPATGWGVVSKSIGRKRLANTIDVCGRKPGVQRY
ncbi:MAG TPA: cache domain-containing protein [Bryobacteraceae bacterium]|nr:cache domain-containing protein [Bryobacteraceae bacterium]